MKTEEHKRLIARMNEVQPSDDAAILITMDVGGDIRFATFGEPIPLNKLKNWAYKWLGGNV